MKKNSFSLIISGLLIFSASAFVGWQVTDSPEKTAAKKPPAQASTRQLHSDRDSQNLKSFRSLKNDQERMRGVIEMARNLPTNEIEEWLEKEKFPFRDDFSNKLFEKIVHQRWADEAPAEFLAWAIRKRSLEGSEYVATVIANHPEIVSEAMAANRDTEIKSKLLKAIVKVDPDLAVAEVRKIVADGSTTGWSFQPPFQLIAEARPAKMEALLKEFPDYPKSDLRNAVFQSKLKDNFAQGLDELISREDGFEIFFSSNQSGGNVAPGEFFPRLRDLPEKWRAQIASQPDYILQAVGRDFQDLDLAWEDLGFDQPQADRLRLYFTESGARWRPLETFATLNDYDFSRAQKEKFFRNALQHSHTEEEWSRIAGALSDPDDRAAFAEMLAARKKNPRRPFQNVNDLVAKLAGEEKFNVDTIGVRWTHADREKLVAAFPNFDEDQKNRLAEMVVESASLDRMPLALQSQAITHVLAHPRGDWLDENRPEVEKIASTYAINLLKKDPADLTTWLAQLPEDQVRLQVKKNIARNWPKLDPQAAQKWLASQPADERADIAEFLRSR